MILAQLDHQELRAIKETMEHQDREEKMDHMALGLVLLFWHYLTLVCYEAISWTFMYRENQANVDLMVSQVLLDPRA